SSRSTARSTCAGSTRRRSSTARSSDWARSRASGRTTALDIPPHHDPSCFGCGDRPGGLRLPLPGARGLTEYEAYVAFDESHQGGPGIVHGGIVSAALDEAAGLLATWHSFPCVTARLFVRYRRPVPINTELQISARLVDVHGRRLHIDARITNGDEPL